MSLVRNQQVRAFLKDPTAVVLLILVAVPILLNEIMLFPELSQPVPSINDDAAHYMLVRRASAALAGGANPFDHWVPAVELGFPVFLYYQHLPHLAVAFLHRLLLEQVGLLTLFNLVRYILLLGFPLTVYWSMRQMDFSLVASAIAAAFASLLSSNGRYGFEYDSYIWRGWGMYTQLWAMHLFFIALACIQRLLARGRGYLSAALAGSALILSHVVYAYMMAVAAIVLLLLNLWLHRERAYRLVFRLGFVGLTVAIITAYLWIGFVIYKAYLAVGVYLARAKFDSYGAGQILAWVVGGKLLDYGRLPMLTALLGLGLVCAVVTSSRPARLALVMFVVWLVLYFGRPTWGELIDFVPLHEGLMMERFIGGVDFAAILLIGLGGEWLWRRFETLSSPWHAVAPGILMLALMLPALRERRDWYAQNTAWLDETARALDTDPDWKTIIATLGRQPPGRVYAGMRWNWGDKMRFGTDVRFLDLLTFYGIPAVSPLYQDLSLNAELSLHFDDRIPSNYDVFDVAFVIAPTGLAMPAFLTAIKQTRRYTLYRTASSGYGEFVAIGAWVTVDSQASLFEGNKNWLASSEPQARRYIRWNYTPANRGPEPPRSFGDPTTGVIREERIQPQWMEFTVDCTKLSTFVIKVSYHPKWQIKIDGKQQPTFMVSPSYIGVAVPPGRHYVLAEYKSGRLKNGLLLLSASTLLMILLFKNKFSRAEAWVFGS